MFIYFDLLPFVYAIYNAFLHLWSKESTCVGDPESSVNFKEETSDNGDLRNEGQKTRSEHLKLQTEN